MEKWFDYPLRIVRSKRRKRVSIRIVPGEICVSVPQRMDERIVQQMVMQKRQWIERKVAESTALPQPECYHYVDGESFDYLGARHTLRLEKGYPNWVVQQEQELVVTAGRRLSTEQRSRSAERQLKQWYRQQAEVWLQARTDHFATEIGVVPQSVVVRLYRARWGSCSSRGEIRYNWKLMMAPVDIIDYVVVHELCHLLQGNHSAAYWALVGRYLPDYRQRREWLKRQGHRLLAW